MEKENKSFAGRIGSFFASLKSRGFKAGGYSLAAALILIGVAVMINLAVAGLPARLTEKDLTASGIYTLSDQSEKLLKNLNQDVTLYWVVRNGSEDLTLQHLLELYAQSSGVKLVKKDPDVYPTFATQYTDSVSDNDLIVESAVRYRFVDYDEIYQYDTTNYYYDGTYEVYFDGESQITSAISYVLNEEIPKLYIVSGHGEKTLSDSFTTAVSRDNYETEDLDLLTIEVIPSDADALVMLDPTADLAVEEIGMIRDYLEQGGKLFLSTTLPEEGRLTNIEVLMAEYGMETVEGLVIEGHRSYYAWSTPYYLVPSLAVHDITDPLSDAGSRVLLPLGQGLTIAEDLPDGVTVSELLMTSSSAFSKVAGWKLSTYTQEEDDITGPFDLALAAEKGDTRIVWVSSGNITEDTVNQSVSGGNQNFFLNSLGWMVQQKESSLSIRSKSMSSSYLTLTNSDITRIKSMALFILPLGYLALGIVVFVRRKRR